jgi:hypothetical protein
MKIKHLLTISVMAILLIPQLSCKREWAAKINDSTTISMDEFNKFYYLQAKALLNTESIEEIDKLAADPRSEKTMLNKNNFLRYLVAQKLLYKKAMDDKNMDKDELNTYSEFTKMQSVNQYYLMKKFKDRIMVSDAEIDEAYRMNRAQFVGRTADEATMAIRQQLSARKFGYESNTYLENLLGEHKIDYDGLKEYLKKQDPTSGEAKTEEKPEEKK